MVAAGDVEGVADGFQPGGGAVVADRCGADDGPARRFELAEGCRVERVDGGGHRAVEGGVQLAPFPRRDHGAGRQPQRLQHHADADGIGREHLADQGDAGAFAASGAGGLDGALFGLAPCIGQHGSGKDVLGFRMGRDAEAGDVDADDPDAVDLLRQQAERHAGCRRDAQVDDDDGVVERGVGQLEDGLADVLEQLAGDQQFRVERHVADGPLRPVEMRREGQAVDAARRAGQDGRGAPHPQADPERAERRAHALRLVVRSHRVIGGVAFDRLVHAGGGGRRAEVRLVAVAGRFRADRVHALAPSPVQTVS